MISGQAGATELALLLWGAQLAVGLRLLPALLCLSAYAFGACCVRCGRLRYNFWQRGAYVLHKCFFRFFLVLELVLKRKVA